MILCIDTSMEHASVGLAREGRLLVSRENADQKDHASWIHPAVREMMEELRMEWSGLEAVAVSAGPGSYTGLRVGMATAKGICFSMEIPLITESTLLLMADDVRAKAKSLEATMICPLIDARRMEVFMGLYDLEIREILAAQAAILEPGFLQEILFDHKVMFTGSGVPKWKELASSPNALFGVHGQLAKSLAAAAYLKYQQGQFTDLIHSEPAYIKEFYTHTKK